MIDNNQDRSQGEGQEGIDRETEQRNRENETGQSGQPGQTDKGQQFSAEQRQRLGEAAERGEQADTTTASQQQTGGQSATGQGSSGGGGFVGSQQDNSSDYLTKGEENQDFAPEGRGAQESSAGRSDIETGQSQDRDPSSDDGSESDR